MGTKIGRTRKDGTTAYLAQILLKRKGKIVHRECQTFDRKQTAKTWLARRKKELSQPGALDRKNDVKLADVIDRYVEESERELRRTKAGAATTTPSRCTPLSATNHQQTEVFVPALAAWPAAPPCCLRRSRWRKRQL
jgi:hypothetical protein